jgi:hypothetical protein
MGNELVKAKSGQMNKGNAAEDEEPWRTATLHDVLCCRSLLTLKSLSSKGVPQFRRG